MKTIRVAASVLVLCVLAGARAVAQQDTLSRADELERQGSFQEAAKTLSAALESNTNSPAQRKQLEFERDRLERIRKDFPWTQEALFAELKKNVRGLSNEEFGRWVKEGRFDSREIDGTRLFMGSSVGNLFWRYPELSPRRMPPKDTRAVERRSWETCVAIKHAAITERKPYVLPKRFRVAMTVTAEPNAAPNGEIIRAWLPIPREYPFQGDFSLLATSALLKQMDAKDSAIRSALLEKPAVKDKPTSFKIDYEYTAHGVWFNVDPTRVRPFDGQDATLKQFTSEAPHIVFTPEMRALSDRIAGTESNLYLKAKKFHDWIAENIKYSFALEYSTMRNIGEYCRSHGYGDCGQEALLFMTLCRLNGIPARWQSGWNTFPGAKSIHDWAEIYVAPYGWIPVDPYMGIFAMRYATSLTPAQRREIRDFYFGGLDQYRMIANSDHNQRLNPPKESMRSDNVDFQRGELEWGNHNIYLDEYSYQLEVREMKPNPARIE
ncbi:MAG TPA: transglutaminase-like domain-containing protein [Verrucomicrobiae bacterium]